MSSRDNYLDYLLEGVPIGHEYLADNLLIRYRPVLRFCFLDHFFRVDLQCSFPGLRLGRMMLLFLCPAPTALALSRR